MLDNLERKSRIKKYARLAAEIGLNVQKGEEVWVSASLDQPEFVAMIVEECYKLGAKKVVVDWSYPKLTELAFKYQSVSTLATLNNIEKLNTSIV